MIKITIVLTVLLLLTTESFCQFNLYIEGASPFELEVSVPGGSENRYLVIKDRDSITVDSLFLENCLSGCIHLFDDLLPATIYLLQLYDDNTIQDERWAVTSSTSSGSVEVYFTTSVDSTVSQGNFATATEGGLLEEAIITAINQANFTIDAMLYNINRRPVANALADAYGRGVRVRYLTSDNTSNLALSNPTPDFPILVGNLGAGLMHNKVFVIDAEDPDRALVITGATNMTSGQVFTDHNHMLFIQDQSLARAYEKEVDEMWGSSTESPDITLSRFGPSKKDDTPHEIYIHNTLYELYFSPSDNTTFKIVNTLNSAQKDCYFALLLFTRSNLATTVINLHNRGIEVRGLMNNTFENGSQFNNLVSNGVFVLHYTNGPMLHHKYCLIDVNGPDDNSKLITGSHNWSNNAENRNDENTLIIHDVNIVDVFFQEFQARWCEEFRGDDCQLITTTDDLYLDNIDYKLHYNDESSELYIFTEELINDRYSMSIYNANGQMVYSRVNFNIDTDAPYITNLRLLNTGVYFVVLQSDRSRVTRSFVVE